jgi:hypothetical protein
MGAHHECLADLYAGAVANRQEFLGLGHGHTQRLFAQHVLAGLGCFDGPGNMQLVGQRVVDGLDLRIGQQFFVRSVSVGDAQRARCFLGLVVVARSDGSHLAPLTLLHGRDDLLHPDGGRAQNSPSNFGFSHRLTS